MADKIVQPSEEFVQAHRGKLINALPKNREQPEDVQTYSPDQLDHIDKKTMQRANAMLADAQLKELKDRNNLSDTPYVHNSTMGFGSDFLNGWWDLGGLFPNNRSQRILTVLLIGLTIIGLAIKYLPKIF